MIYKRYFVKAKGEMSLQSYCIATVWFFENSVDAFNMAFKHFDGIFKGGKYFISDIKRVD